MKTIIILFFLLGAGYIVLAQNDTLQIELKSGGVEKIAVTNYVYNVMRTVVFFLIAVISNLLAFQFTTTFAIINFSGENI